MYFLLTFILSLSAIPISSKRVGFNPRIVSIQINRCPTPTIYENAYEEENDRRESFKRRVVRSDFDETLRFQPNESGTIQLFVVCRGNTSVSIESDESVFDELLGNHHIDGQQGGAVISVPFKVLNSVRETSISVTLITRTIKKITTIYASTKNLEPPRPPSLHTSLIFTPEELANIDGNETEPVDASTHPDPIETATPPPDETEITESDGSSGNVAISQSSIEDIEFPSVDEILNGKYSNIESKSLRLDSINLNRITADKTDRFVSKSNVYHVTIKKFEKGQIIFYVSGGGNKKVTVKSLADFELPAKVMKVSNDYAAFAYTDGKGYVEEDRILVRVENDLDEILYFYLVMKREV